MLEFKLEKVMVSRLRSHLLPSGDFFTFYDSLPFATSEPELDYYHQKLNIQVTSLVAKQRKTSDLRK